MGQTIDAFPRGNLVSGAVEAAQPVGEGLAFVGFHDAGGAARLEPEAAGGRELSVALLVILEGQDAAFVGEFEHHVGAAAQRDRPAFPPAVFGHVMQHEHARASREGDVAAGVHEGAHVPRVVFVAPGHAARERIEHEQARPAGDAVAHVLEERRHVVGLHEVHGLEHEMRMIEPAVATIASANP